MARGIVNPTTGEVTYTAGLVNDAEIQQRLSTAESDIDGIEAVIPSGASESNQLVDKNTTHRKRSYIYNPDTDRTVIANRKSAVETLLAEALTMCGASGFYSACVRYSGGYYYTYNISIGVDTLVASIEEISSYHNNKVFNLWYATKENDVWTANLTQELMPTSTVTSGSNSPITSGGVYSALNTVNYGTATRNSATMTGESFVGKWHKCGKLVMAEVQGNTVASEITSDSNLMTGFPKPLENVALVAQGGTNAAAVGIVLKTDGALRSHYNMSASTFFHATFTYITSE